MEALRDWRLPKASKETIVREEHHHTETRAETVPQSVIERIEHLEEALKQVLDLMEARQITVLPVLDENGFLVGLVHVHDLLGKGRVRFAPE